MASSSSSSSSSGHRGADTEADLSNLSPSQLISYLLRGPTPPSSDNPDDLVAVVRELSAREVQHKAVLAENEALRRQSSARRIKEEIQGHIKVALSEIHEVHEEGAFRLEAMLSVSERSGRQEDKEAVVSDIFAGQKKRLGKIAAEARAKVNSSFSKVIGASGTRGRGRGRGRGRCRGRGRGISPAQARAAAAAVSYMEDLAAPLSTTVLVGRSSYSFLRRSGKVPVVEYIDSEEERDGLREEEENIEAMEKKRERMRADDGPSMPVLSNDTSSDEDSSGIWIY